MRRAVVVVDALDGESYGESVAGIDEIIRIPRRRTLRYAQGVVSVIRVVSGGGMHIRNIDPAHRLAGLDEQADGVEPDMRAVGIASHLDLGQIGKATGRERGGQ